MKDSEIGQLIAGVYDHLIGVEKRLREVKLIALATKDTLVHLHPDAAAVYEAAYSKHSASTAVAHKQLIDELQNIAQELRIWP
jgi:hypothetical protein